METPMTALKTMLSAAGVTHQYGARVALENVTLETHPGEMLALIGPNGAGKTTLLKILAGLIKPQIGQVVAPQPRAKRVAYLAQSEPLPEHFATREVVALGRLPHRGAWATETAADRQAIDAALLACDARGFEHRRIGELSGGERQRVALARALAQEPEILLLDEPTNHLDLAHQAELLRLLRDALRGEQPLQTVVMVVHDLNIAARADRIVLLHEGRVLRDGPPFETLEPSLLERAYGTRVQRLQTPDGRVVVVLE
jgi:iron complex transport system ATP-binding protein